MQFFLALIAAAPLALGAVITPRQGGLPVRLPPVAISTLNVNTGAVTYNDDTALIKRTSSVEISHLATFTFPPATAGKTCHIYFDVAVGTGHVISGSKQADIFTVGGNPTKSTTGFPREFYRDNLLGRFTAKFDAPSYIQAPQEFPCPAGQTKTYEAVPAGEAVEINADSPSGIQIRYW